MVLTHGENTFCCRVFDRWSCTRVTECLGNVMARNRTGQPGETVGTGNTVSWPPANELGRPLPLSDWRLALGCARLNLSSLPSAWRTTNSSSILSSYSSFGCLPSPVACSTTPGPSPSCGPVARPASPTRLPVPTISCANSPRHAKVPGWIYRSHRRTTLSCRRTEKITNDCGI